MYIGYGILTDNIKWKTDSYQILMKIAMEKCPQIKEVYEDNLENYECYETTDEKYSAFVMDYESVNGWNSGFDAMLIDVINEAENLPDETFEMEDCCICVATSIPYDDEEKPKMLTQMDIQRILGEYISKLSDTVLEFGFYHIDA